MEIILSVSVCSLFLGVSMVQWLGCWTSDQAVMGLILSPCIIRHLVQLSRPSLQSTGKSSTSLHRLRLMRGVLAYVELRVKW